MHDEQSTSMMFVLAMNPPHEIHYAEGCQLLRLIIKSFTLVCYSGVSVSQSILGRLRIPTDNLLASSFVPGSPSAFGRGILPQFSLHLSWCSVKIWPSQLSKTILNTYVLPPVLSRVILVFFNQRYQAVHEMKKDIEPHCWHYALFTRKYLLNFVMERDLSRSILSRTNYFESHMRLTGFTRKKMYLD